MGLIWKNKNGTINAVDGGVVRTCPCCPCNEWSIVVVCYRANDCETALDPCSKDVTLYAEDIVPSSYKAGVLSTNTLGHIIYSPFTVSYSGRAQFTAWVDDVKQPATGGESVEFSEDDEITYSHAYGDTITAGPHRVRITVDVYDESSNLVESFGRGACILGWTVEDANPDAHTVEIVPSLVAGDCLNDTKKYTQLLGPYDSIKDAEYVYLTWAATIEEYAAKCFCQEACGTDGTGSALDLYGTYTVLPDGAFESSGGGGVGTLGNCPYPLLVSRWIVEDGLGAGDTLDIREVGGSTIHKGTTGGGTDEGGFIIPPCKSIEFVVDHPSGPITELIVSATAFVEGEIDEPCTAELTNNFNAIPANGELLLSWWNEFMVAGLYLSYMPERFV